MYDVIPDRDVDPVIVVLESPIRLMGFGPDAFSVDQLMETSCPLIGPLHDGFSNSLEGVSTNVFSPSRKCKQLLTPYQFEQLLREVSQVSPRCASLLSLGHTAPKSADRFPSCIMFEEELDEAYRFIAHAENIISTVLRQYLKFFDGLLTLRDRFLVVDVNLRVAKGMNLASEEMLVKSRKCMPTYLFVIVTLWPRLPC
ncbi:unnamed protein product [Lactuca virosa]|uniref:Uncharacterized protein n=1 Tax=Lactuca virosa TaxID=75947 RepID=A0AAU9M9U9_9ASTR|nr:unnamed protein product [Lactuca virosa]